MRRGIGRRGTGRNRVCGISFGKRGFAPCRAAHHRILRKAEAGPRLKAGATDGLDLIHPIFAVVAGDRSRCLPHHPSVNQRAFYRHNRRKQLANQLDQLGRLVGGGVADIEQVFVAHGEALREEIGPGAHHV